MYHNLHHRLKKQVYLDIWPRVDKAIQNQDQDQAQVKNDGTFLKHSIII